MSDRADGDQTETSLMMAAPPAAETDPDTPPGKMPERALDRAQWIARTEALCAEEGYFEPLGRRHHAYFHDDGGTLLVSFESMDAILTRRGQMPFGHDIAVVNHWSHLTLICEGETWFRDPAVWGYFDRLVDEAFFEDFDRVIFYGAGMCGYAACAYSVCAPGATVLAVNPRATLDPSVAGWDRRALAARRLDFTSRYGFAPDMTDGAARVYLIHDPLTPENAMHAALFRRPWVTSLPTRHFGDTIERAIELTGAFPEIIAALLDDRLTPAVFARIWRLRRNYAPYLRTILRKADLAQRPRHALMICRSVSNRLGAPRFRRRMQELEAQLGATPATEGGKPN